MPVITEKKDCILLQVKVIPGQPVNKISHIHGDRMVMKIKAPPDKGKANRELTAFLAKKMGVSRSLVSVFQGQTSHFKLVLLPLSCVRVLKQLVDSLEST